MRVLGSCQQYEQVVLMDKGDHHRNLVVLAFWKNTDVFCLKSVAVLRMNSDKVGSTILRF